MNSAKVFAGNLPLITRNNGTVPTGPTGIKSHRFEKIRIDRDVSRIGEAKRVAVGCGFCDRLHGDVAACTRTVVDHMRLSGPGRDVMAQNSSHDVGGGARCSEK